MPSVRRTFAPGCPFPPRGAEGPPVPLTREDHSACEGHGTSPDASQVACWQCPSGWHCQRRLRAWPRGLLGVSSGTHSQLRPRVWHSHLAVPCSWEHKTRHVARPSATPAHVLLAGSRPPPAFSGVALWPAGSVLRNALPSFARVSCTAIWPCRAPWEHETLCFGNGGGGLRGGEVLVHCSPTLTTHRTLPGGVRRRVGEGGKRKFKAARTHTHTHTRTHTPSLTNPREPEPPATASGAAGTMRGVVREGERETHDNLLPTLTTH